MLKGRGIKMTRELTCIICPRGCSLKAELDKSGKFLSVSGNICKRGEKYAFDECTSPMRTLTTTVLCSDGNVLPVRSLTSIPKEKLFEAMELVNKTIAQTPISVGDIIIDDFYGTKLIATANSKGIL